MPSGEFSIYMYYRVLNTQNDEKQQIKMGANQSQDKKRKRDLLMGMCMQRGQQNESVPKLKKSLSENMQKSTQDILSKMSDEEMPQLPIKVIQYFFTFLTINECRELRLVNRKLKFMVEMSSNIYANWLSQHYIRKLQPHSFVEYGFHQRFLSVYREQLQKIETNQDESWYRIYNNFHNNINSIRILEDEIHKRYNVEYPLSDKIYEISKNPSIPIPILTDDILKQSTTSWFQLDLAQPVNDYSVVEKILTLDDLTEKLYQDCLQNFDPNNLKHTQLLFELKWIVIDNFINEPQQLDQENIPLLLKLLLQVFHFVYQRCLFCRNVLIILKSDKIPTQLLSMYTILWESQMSIIWGLNRALKKMFNQLDRLFNTYFTTSCPPITFTSAMTRLWTQIVIKGTKNQNDPLEIELFNSYQYLLKNKRQTLFQFFIKDQIDNTNRKNNNHYYEDQYFKYYSTAIDYLLNKFTSNILDLSLNEHSIHWIGHSQFKVGSLYSNLLELIVNQSNDLYLQASSQLGANFQVYKDYLESDTKYIQEILNKWTVQVCVMPIAIQHLYDKVKINIRQHVLSFIENEQQQQIQQQQQQFEDDILESTIITTEEIQDPLLESVICQILKEEKQQQSRILKQQTTTNNCQSIIENDQCQKTRILSTFTCSTRVSQITQLTSVFSQNPLSSIRSNLNLFLVRDIKNKLEHNQWTNNLKSVSLLEIENQKQIDKRNNSIQMRNLFKKIPQEINLTIDFTQVSSLEEVMLLFQQKNEIIQQQQIINQRDFSELSFGQGLFASSFNQ